MEGLIRDLQLQPNDAGSPLVAAFLADGPTRFDDIHESADPATRDFALAVGARSFVAAPLITKGKRVGVLAVDNALTGRSLDSRSDALLVTLGHQIAAGVESARLHARVEAQNRALEERVIARTAELEQAKREVRELRIEIDGARQAQQVADIVGTEYFQSLRSQARDLRKIVANR